MEEFFQRLKTPIEEMTAEQVKENHKVVGAIGVLCMIFGTFVLLLMLVPNEGMKRLAFLFCGGCILGRNTSAPPDKARARERMPVSRRPGGDCAAS